ncbi:hypothetical protein AGDE_06330 [Angomonas deanei]|nr:hypothetical protein AGDE_06330 [Angomonas deanei]|eukprot:EPY37604.1 hypothetical protein AGDE_06330 [Angomonas deanei]
MMQAMSRPMNKDHTLTCNNGRFSNAIYINDPKRNQALSTGLAKRLNVELDRATNGVYSKLTVLEAAQSGMTDYFCGGLDVEKLGLDVSMAAISRERSKEAAAAGDQKEAQLLLGDATLYEDRADRMVREHGALIHRISTAARPLMTLVNGKCRGTGCGVALAAKYCGLKDISEFIVDGPNIGLTTYGGVTRLLARPETSHKYPGLAEFVLLTGTSLFAGDVLRLGWTDLFTSLPDMNYHIKEWFNNTEHMHNDAVAWQLGQLLETCFKMRDAHSSAMERCAITSLRAQWIEDAFADQASVEDILKTLGEIEKLPLTDPHNKADRSSATPFTIGSVSEGIEKLQRANLRYTLDPWDVTAPEEEVAVCQAAEIFTSYVLERRGKRDMVVNTRRQQLQRWKEQREREYRRVRR